MQPPVSLKSAERKAFQTSFADGLWDVFLGCFALEFAIAPFLSPYLGDFWSSFVFLPFWGLAYLAIWLTRKHVVAPRIGTVRFGPLRKRKLRRFSLVMVGVNIVAFLLGLVAALNFNNLATGGSAGLFSVFPVLLGLILLGGFSTAAYLLDYPRLYIYGLLLLIACPVGEWLYAYHNASHHGWPITFGFTSAVMIFTGLFLFVRLLKNNPVVEHEGA
jgi:hypothetical protein